MLPRNGPRSAVGDWIQQRGSRSVEARLGDTEDQAISRSDGKEWTRNVTGNLGLNPEKALTNRLAHFANGQSWVREDGATANRPPGGMFFRLALPQAAKYEAELKAIRERKQRETVPTF